MKILIVSQYFWPEVFRINDLCSELLKRDHRVTVLTGIPNYPDGSVFPDFKENPSKYCNFSKANVIRVPMMVRGQNSSIRLFFNYISYAVSASILGWIKLRKSDFDVIFVFQTSPVTVGIPAVLLKKAKNIPVVFWVLDIWPDTLEAVGVVRSKFLLTQVGKVVSFIYNRCDLVLGQSQSFLDRIGHYCKDKSKIRYFPSWSEEMFANSSVDTMDCLTKYNDDFRVLFAGNVGEAQDFPSIIRTAELLKEKDARVKLFVAGDGRKLAWVEQQVKEKSLGNYIHLLGRHPLESMPAFYASADALLVCLKSTPIFSMTIPGKLQSYMSAGKPILAMIDGEGARVVDEANAGYSCNSGNADKLVENILAMSKLNQNDLKVFGDNAIAYAKKEFSREQLISQLESWFEEVSVKYK